MHPPGHPDDETVETDNETVETVVVGGTMFIFKSAEKKAMPKPSLPATIMRSTMVDYKAAPTTFDVPSEFQTPVVPIPKEPPKACKVCGAFGGHSDDCPIGEDGFMSAESFIEWRRKAKKA
jgi:hypothetical protein